jgi:hypothetical protein
MVIYANTLIPSPSELLSLLPPSLISDHVLSNTNLSLVLCNIPIPDKCYPVLGKTLVVLQCLDVLKTTM